MAYDDTNILGNAAGLNIPGLSMDILKKILGNNPQDEQQSDIPDSLKGLDLSGTSYDKQYQGKTISDILKMAPKQSADQIELQKQLNDPSIPDLKVTQESAIKPRSSLNIPSAIPQSVSLPNGTPELSDQDASQLNDILTNKQPSAHQLSPEQEYQQALDEKKRVLGMAGLAKAGAQIGSSIAGLGAKAEIKPSIDTSSMEEIAKGYGEGALQKMKDQEKKQALVASLMEKAQARKDKMEENARREKDRSEDMAYKRDVQQQYLDLKKQGLTDKEAKDVTDKTEAFSKRLEKSGLPEQIDHLNKINEVLNKNGGSIYSPPGDIPGLGLGKSMLPDVALSDDGVKMRQNVQALANTLLKSRSGGAVTPSEYQRFVVEASKGNFSEAKDTMQFVQRMADEVDKATKNIEAYKPEVKDSYKKYVGQDLPSEMMNFKRQEKQSSEPQSQPEYSPAEENGINAVMQHNKVSREAAIKALKSAGKL